MVKKENDLLGVQRSRSLHQMDVFQIPLTAKLASPTQMWFCDLQRVGPLMARLWEFVPTQTFLSIQALKLISLYCHVVLFIYLFLSPSCSKDAAGFCCGSDSAECFLRPRLPVGSSVQTRPEWQERSERRGRREEAEPAAHRVHPHRRPGERERDAVNISWGLI